MPFGGWGRGRGSRWLENDSPAGPSRSTFHLLTSGDSLPWEPREGVPKGATAKTPIALLCSWVPFSALASVFYSLLFPEACSALPISGNSGVCRKGQYWAVSRKRAGFDFSLPCTQREDSYSMGLLIHSFNTYLAPFGSLWFAGCGVGRRAGWWCCNLDRPGK